MPKHFTVVTVMSYMYSTCRYLGKLCSLFRSQLIDPEFKRWRRKYSAAIGVVWRWEVNGAGGVGEIMLEVWGKWCWRCGGNSVRGVGEMVLEVWGKWCWRCGENGVGGVGEMVLEVWRKWCWRCGGNSATWREAMTESTKVKLWSYGT